MTPFVEQSKLIPNDFVEYKKIQVMYFNDSYFWKYVVNVK